jgi:hypothetical protein
VCVSERNAIHLAPRAAHRVGTPTGSPVPYAFGSGAGAQYRVPSAEYSALPPRGIERGKLTGHFGLDYGPPPADSDWMTAPRFQQSQPSTILPFS